MEFSRRNFLLSFIGLTLATGMGSCQVIDRKISVTVSNGATVLCIGDSLTFGKGALASQTYPAHLNNVTGKKLVIHNEGVNGETSLQILARLERLLEKYSPEVVIITAGGNDFLRQGSVDEVSENINKMISLINSKNSQAVLLAVPKPSISSGLVGLLSDHEVFDEFKARADVVLVENVISEVLSDKALKSDLIHPNSKGYEKIALAVSGVIKIK